MKNQKSGNACLPVVSHLLMLICGLSIRSRRSSHPQNAGIRFKKFTHSCALGLLSLLFLLTLSTAAQAQFTTSTANGQVTITEYTGSGGAVIIPSIINGLPVTSIGDFAFY